MQMGAALLAALKADLNRPTAAWLAVSAFDETDAPPSDDPMAPPPDRHLTVVVESAVRGESLVFMLAMIGGEPPTEITLNWRGTTFTTADAALITRVMTLVAPTQALLEGNLLEILTAEIA